MHFQMISHNGSLFKEGDIVLSTVQMPKQLRGSLGYNYESCIFVKGDSEVLGRYDRLAEAVLDHVRLRQQYGLKER